jgi:molybdopterin converting factor small subunit
VEVEADTVDNALEALVRLHPSLKPHLYDKHGELRPYVNVFLNERDVRELEGQSTPLQQDDQLMILPSIAGGASGGDAGRTTVLVDHNALRANQGAIILSLGLAFILDLIPLVGATSLIMLGGTVANRPGFAPLYALARKMGLIQPDRVLDHREPHRFAQGSGAAMLLGSTGALVLGLEALGWILTGIVIALAALNLFAGFCVGCALYYWLSRFNVPGFSKDPPGGGVPGMRSTLSEPRS